MEARSLTYVVQACGGELLGGAGSVTVRRVCTDSRELQAGDLFIALRGEKFDGHRFVMEAARKGAVAVMVERDHIPAELPGCAVVAVEQARVALGQLAARYRRDFPIPRIAVAGSNGKTTTKDLIAAVLGERFPTLRSQSSFNNDVGVPLTLLNLEPHHGAAVLEVGTNHPGELAPLLRLIEPAHGVITSIGREHLEFFGDLTGVIDEEGWLAELLPADGRLYLNGDSPGGQQIINRTPAPVVRVGLTEGNDWRAQVMRMDSSGLAFRVECADREFAGEYQIQHVGRHQAVNALFALAVGKELGLGPEELRRGLRNCAVPAMRMQLWQAGEVRVLDDCYNANADSMRAALQTLCDLPCRGRRIAVLGDMGELGGHALDAHAEVGRHAAMTGVDRLFAVGKMAPVLARAAREAGLRDVIEIETVDAAAAAVCSDVRAGDQVLLKASRSTRLERVAERLRESQR